MTIFTVSASVDPYVHYSTCNMFMGSKLPGTALAQTHMLACKFMSCDVFSNSCNQIRLKSVAGDNSW